MSLKTIFNDICGIIKDVENIAKNFNSLKTDEERFITAYNCCKDYISELTFKNDNKSSEKSLKVRKVGNENFAKNIHWEALTFYNESIALAPNNSEELALAFGNRAACLIRLDFPVEAMSDVDKALTLPVTDDFRKKLLLRKDKCLTMISNHTKNIYSFGNCEIPELSKGESTFFDSTSNSVGLSYDKYWERQLVAQDDIKTGEVLIVEKPYSSILLPNHYYTHCTNCFKRCITLIPCENCIRAMFCSEECKKISYNRFHKIECFIMEKLVELEAARMELLSLRILIDASKQGDDLENLHIKTLESEASSNNNNNESCNCYKSLDFLNIYNLVTNSSKRKAGDLFYRSVVSTILVMILEKNTNFFSTISKRNEQDIKMFCGGLILRFMQSLPCNAHEISEFCEEGLNEIGAGAYATLSLINHSCDPNVVRHSYQDVVVLRAIRPIKSGEQILDNYGYHYATHSYSERQNSLMKQYYFKCQCEACVNLWGLYEDLPEIQLRLKKTIDIDIYRLLSQRFENNLENVFNGTFTFDIIPEFMAYLDFLDEFLQRPWKPYNKCQEALKHCLSFLGNHFRFSKGVVTS